MYHARYRGFTFVELLAVIVLLGILGITAFARFSGTAAYRPHVIANQLLAEIALAQQLALSRADAVVALQLTADTNAFTATTLLSGVPARSELVDRDGVALSIASGATTGNVSASNPLTLGFTDEGDVASITLGVASGDPGLGATFTFAGSGSASLCLYPSGLVIDGTCL